ncbi:MAG: TlpA family protein disulfide reductase [Anaerolineales bacterium]|nr:TlpA family protein disulfide reductase [Chloroflexota bacterium]MBL6983859.1 TlpA family protein disulfide reductase [Anaerolineales bacterium]
MKTLDKKYRLPLYFLILLLSAAWIWVSAAPEGSTSAGEIPAPQEGFLAPDFTLETLEGELMTLSELRGSPVLINLWASWCGPCRAEMPAMQRIHEKYGDEFIILAVNATHQDSPNAAAAFVSELGLTFPILLDHDGSVSTQYQLRSLPTSFFVNRDGIIEEVVIGGPMSEALLQTRIESLLEEAP